MDRIGTPEIIDICLVGALVLLGIVGSWRGAVKEVFISASLLLSVLVTQFWTASWAEQLQDWFDLSTDNAELIVRIAIPIAASILIGYVASVNAGIPPADVPGRVGGFVLAAMNGVVLFAIIGSAIYSLYLDTPEQETLSETRLARALIFDFDRIVLVISAIALVMAFASISVRRRRMAILAPAGAAKAGSSGYQIRRDKPLAPEAEKIETGTRSASGDPLGETMPIARVSDSSATYNRPVEPASTWKVVTAEDERAGQTEVVRCVSCGERLSGDDRFCPRCGRSLVR